jgi:uncharacterized protein (TIGR04141 family)
MDGKTVKIPGETPVELCDLYTAAGGFMHAKRHWRSSTLSHLAAQGRVSAELMLHQPAFRRAAAERLRDVDTDGRFPFEPDKYRSAGTEVGYVIIGRLDGKRIVERMPMLARIHLAAAVEDLQSVGYRVTLTAVEPATP